MRFSNPYQKASPNFFRFLLWRLGFIKNTQPLHAPPNFVFPNKKESVDFSCPTVTWINHSTFWVKAFHKSLLTDPIWSDRCSPISFLGPKRHHAPSPSLETLKTLDAVFISHDHYDHLDEKTIFQILKKFSEVVFVIPTGVKKWFVKKFPQIRANQIHELGWWESVKIKNMHITAVPAQHFSGRSPTLKNSTLWSGYVVIFSEGKKFYFAGDTGYNPHQFKEIGQNFGPFDLSLIPIGSYCPQSFMKAVHVNPQESLLVHQDVRSKFTIGGHWKTFKLSDEMLERPPYDLYLALKEANLSENDFRVLDPGQSVNW